MACRILPSFIFVTLNLFFDDIFFLIGIVVYRYATAFEVVFNLGLSWGRNTLACLVRIESEDFDLPW